MASTTVVHACPHCGGERLQKNGHTQRGAQRALCVECKRTFTLSPKGPRHGPKFKEQVLSAYQDRINLRGLHRTLGVCDTTVMRWLGEKTAQLPAFVETLLPAEKGDVLVLDELWSFVQSKAQTLWLGVALCRRTRQIVAWTLGDRSQQSAADLRAALPKDYRRRATRSDLWEASAAAFPVRTHPLLRQERKRDLPGRALVWHPARPRQPLGPQSLLLFQTPGKPPRRHPLLHHHLQPPNQAINTSVNITQ